MENKNKTVGAGVEQEVDKSVKEFDTKKNPYYFGIGDGWSGKPIDLVFRAINQKFGNRNTTRHTLVGRYNDNFVIEHKISPALRDFLLANGGVNKIYKGYLVEGIGQESKKHFLGLDVQFDKYMKDRIFFEWEHLHALRLYGLAKIIEVQP